MRQYIGGVIAERNVLSPLCLLVKSSLFNWALASGNGNRFFTQKWHLQITNNPLDGHSPRLMLNYRLLPTHLIFRYYLPLMFAGSTGSSTGRRLATCPMWGSWPRRRRSTAHTTRPSRYRPRSAVACPVLRIRIRDPVPFWPLDPGSGMGKKIKIRIREPDPGWTFWIIFPRA